MDNHPGMKRRLIGGWRSSVVVRTIVALCLTTTVAASGRAAASPVPQSELIVFSYVLPSLPGDIYVVAPDGSGLTNVTQSPWHDTMPAWSPDGTKIVFISNRDGTSPLLGQWDVYVMNADGSDIRNVTQTNGRSERTPTWTPDGSAIIFERRTLGDPPLYRLDLSSGQERPLGYGSNPAVSPDGRRIAFDTGNEEGAEDWVMLMRSDGSGRRSFRSDDWDDRHPDWSPSGRSIAFTRDDDLAIARADASRLRALEAPNGTAYEHPTWSPDDRSLAVVHREQIYTLDRAGGEPRQVTSFVGAGYTAYLDWRT